MARPPRQPHRLRAAQPPLGIPAAPDRLPLGEARLHPLEVLAAREGVLGQVDAAALAMTSSFSASISGSRPAPHREVDGDRDPRLGKRQQPLPFRPAVLDHADRRGAPRLVTSSRTARHGRRPLSCGNTHWYCVNPVLAEQRGSSAGSRRADRRNVRVDDPRRLRRVHAVSRTVEDARRQAIERPAGQVEGDREPLLVRGGCGGRLGRRRPAARYITPRPRCLPRVTQSIHPLVNGQSAAARSSAVEELADVVHALGLDPHPGRRSRAIRNSTSRMCPVRPMPPTVARNRSGSSLREQSRMRPSATRMRRRVTCPPKQPSRW